MAEAMPPPAPRRGSIPLDFPAEKADAIKAAEKACENAACYLTEVPS